MINPPDGHNTVTDPGHNAHFMFFRIKSGCADFCPKQGDDIFHTACRDGLFHEFFADLFQSAAHTPVVFVTADADDEATQQILVLLHGYFYGPGLVFLFQEIPDLN